MSSYLKISLVGMAVLSCLSPTLVCTEQPHGFVDRRHEYLDDTRTHTDCVGFGTFFSNGIGLMGELRYSTDGDDRDKWDPSQFGNNRTGSPVVYRSKPLDDKKSRLEPVFWLDTTWYWPTYEYGLSASYDSNKEWRVSGQFRCDMDRAIDKPKGYGNDDRNNHRYDVWIDYRPQRTNFQYQLNLVHYDNGYLAWNDDHKNYTASFKVGYKIGSWIPYISIADHKGVDKTSGSRQICWRWSLTYTL